MRKHYDGGNLPSTQKDATAQGVVWLTLHSTEKASSDYLPPSALQAWMQERKAAAFQPRSLSDLGRRKRT